MKESVELKVFRNGNKEFNIGVGTSDQPITYIVAPMFDADAPDGFQKHRTSKIIDPNIYNRVRLTVYDEARKSYDTGLTKNSKALSRIYPDEAERQVALKNITKYITNPLIEIYGADAIDPKNVDFWDKYTENVGLDKVYDTSDPAQLAALYFLILHGKLCPLGMESESYFKGYAQYAIENKEHVVDVSQKRKLETSRAKSRFINLLDTDKEGLTAILEWMGISGLTGTSDELLNDIFTDWLEKDDNQNPKQFLEVYKNYYESPAGKKELTMFKELKHLQRNKKISKTTNGFNIGDTFLGKNLKEAAINVLKDDTLLEKVYALADV